MFANKIDEIQTQSEIILSHHFMSDIAWSQLDNGQKALLIAFILSVLIVVGRELYEIYRDIYKLDRFQDATLPNYFYGLKKNDLREFLDEEIAFRAYGFHLLEDKTRDRVIRIYEGKSKGS